MCGNAQDSEGGDGRHCPSPPMNGSQSWRGSLFDDGSGRPGLKRDLFFALPSATSCFVGQPLTLDALDRAISTSGIVNTKSDSVAIAEIELGEVAVKVRLADVEITPVDPAFQQREEAFDGVDVCFHTVG